ncbi:conserved hypothetical protein [Ricinus communis]|uniref:Uncharacterized protein n=1 Tax=Ricinus communis TaxID=3988 RepID=B9SRK4_RICCO|nr:conserved hypothetical protein [Ricinus communis]
MINNGMPHLVRQIFIPSEANKILQMPISIRLQKIKIFKKCTKFGKFTVRPAYYLATIMESTPVISKPISFFLISNVEKVVEYEYPTKAIRKELFVDLTCYGKRKLNNTDAAIYNDGTVGMGFVVRDDQGEVPLAGSKKNKNLIADIILAEGMTIRWR